MLLSSAFLESLSLVRWDCCRLPTGTVLYKCTTSINVGSSPTRTRSRTHPPRSVDCRLGPPGCCRCHALV